jgi:hypothetical protein
MHDYDVTLSTLALVIRANGYRSAHVDPLSTAPQTASAIASVA